MPGMSGLELLERAATEFPDVPVIIITAHGTVDTAVAGAQGRRLRLHHQAVRAGGAEEDHRQGDPRARARAPERARLRRAAARSSASRRSMRHGLRDRGRGGRLALDRAHHRRERHRQGARRARAPRSSSRRDKPFIKVNCAAIPKDLIESELFGYERGAFTGAVGSKPGRFELADGGTLFLDEIGEIPVEMQVKLLRALQESEFERVGGIKTIHVDVRLIAATNRDLKAAHRRRPLPRGPLLPAQRGPDRAAPAARAQERHPAPRRALHREVQPAARQEGRAASTSEALAGPARATPGRATSASSRTSWSARSLFADGPSSRARRCRTPSASASPARRCPSPRSARSAPSPPRAARR